MKVGNAWKAQRYRNGLEDEVVGSLPKYNFLK